MTLRQLVRNLTQTATEAEDAATDLIAEKRAHIESARGWESTKVALSGYMTNEAAAFYAEADRINHALQTQRHLARWAREAAAAIEEVIG